MAAAEAAARLLRKSRPPGLGFSRAMDGGARARAGANAEGSEAKAPDAKGLKRECG